MNAVIFGAGKWGSIAYHYYEKRYNILAYIDNNCSLWNSKLNGISIMSPAYLNDINATVIISNARHESEIKQQLFSEYGIKSAIVFRIMEGMEELDCSSKNDEEELIISFIGGLGNQMFQYALYRILQKKGKNVKADLSHYLEQGSREFELLKVFPKTTITKANGQNKNRYLAIAPYMNEKIGMKVYLEPNVMNGVKSFANVELLDDKVQFGYFRGYFQTCKFAGLIEKELRNEFEFCNSLDIKLQEMVHFLTQNDVIGVHIRRGDYLNFADMYDDICTDIYYNKAMDMIKSRISNPIFCFFSNDMEWVKSNYREENVIYVEKEMFGTYQDWYDLFLMSLCKHNIIANSSFSWWGAWLNSNPSKIVIAPSKWVNADSMEDICPTEWIRI